MSVKTVIAAGTVLLTCVMATSFMFGWAYEFEYYSVFGVDLRALDLPVYDFLVASLFEMPHALHVIFTLFFITAFITAVTLFVTALRERFWVRALLGKLPNTMTRNSKFARPSNPAELPKWSVDVFRITIVAACCMLVIFLVALPSDHAARLGRESAEAFFRDPDVKVTLIFKSDALPVLKKGFIEANAAGALRVLVQTKDAIAVFVKREYPLHVPQSFIVPISSLAYVENESLKRSTK